LNNKTFTYHPGRLAVELETFTPRPVKIPFKNISDAKRGQKAMAKLISDNNKEIVRLDTVQIKNMNDAYNIEMAKLDKIQVKHDKYVNLEQQIENIEAEKIRVNNIVSIDEMNQAATDNIVKVLKNSTLVRKKKK
jgi:hypothetical protein